MGTNYNYKIHHSPLSDQNIISVAICTLEPATAKLPNANGPPERCIDKKTNLYCKTDPGQNNPYVLLEFERPVPIYQVNLTNIYAPGEWIAIVTDKPPLLGVMDELEGDLEQIKMLGLM